VGRRSALVVGIDAYEVGTPLTSCVADASAVTEVLKRDENGDVNFAVKTMLGEPPSDPVTRQALRPALADALDQARGHDFVFYFSGHGGVDPQFGPAIVTQEGEEIAMDEILTLMNNADFVQATVIIDACFAGNMGQLTALAGRTFLKENVAILGASRNDQSAMSGANLSPFTAVLIDGMNGGAADLRGHVTVTGLYDYAAQSFSATQQSPVLRASIDIGEPLRKVAPPVSLDALKQMPKIFPNGNVYKLRKGDPAKTTRAQRGRVLRTLRELQSGGLVSLGDHDHDLAAAASAAADVQLTPRGRHAIRLVEEELI
jgi:hypothetical protein